MVKHLFKVSGLDAQGKPFIGSCVAFDIIDAINMFRDKHYSPHEVKQDIQMPAEHPCLIVCLQAAQETYVIAQSSVGKPREFPEYMGNPLRNLVTDIYPKKVGWEFGAGVSGCPQDYPLFSRDYCLCTTSKGQCSDCWDQIYTGYYKED